MIFPAPSSQWVANSLPHIFFITVDLRVANGRKREMSSDDEINAASVDGI
jgi:hypothetical protein